jgi:hypothetical protein
MLREKETHITPDEPDVLDANVVPARPWGVWLGVEYVNTQRVDKAIQLESCPAYLYSVITVDF